MQECFSTTTLVLINSKLEVTLGSINKQMLANRFALSTLKVN